VVVRQLAVGRDHVAVRPEADSEDQVVEDHMADLVQQHEADLLDRPALGDHRPRVHVDVPAVGGGERHVERVEQLGLVVEQVGEHG
jgi:hypothetical protein